MVDQLSRFVSLAPAPAPTMDRSVLIERQRGNPRGERCQEITVCRFGCRVGALEAHEEREP